MSGYSWHKHGRAVIPAGRKIGFAQAMPPEVNPKPKPATYKAAPELGLKRDPYA